MPTSGTQTKRPGIQRVFFKQFIYVNDYNVYRCIDGQINMHVYFAKNVVVAGVQVVFFVYKQN